MYMRTNAIQRSRKGLILNIEKVDWYHAMNCTHFSIPSIIFLYYQGIILYNNKKVKYIYFKKKKKKNKKKTRRKEKKKEMQKKMNQ